MINEISEMILEKYGRRDSIIWLNNFQEEIENKQAKLSCDCSLNISYIADVDKCLKCGEDLELVNTYGENRTYQGFDCFETMGDIKCIGCGLTY